MRKKQYKFPDDYLPYIENGYVKVVARPDFKYPIGDDILLENGEVNLEAFPLQYHPIYFFLQDLTHRRVTSLEDARKLLVELTKASMLDIKGQFKGIYNSLQAIKLFLTTEDYHKYGQKLKELQKALEKIKKHMESQDLGIARAEQARTQDLFGILEVKNEQKGAKNG